MTTITDVADLAQYSLGDTAGSTWPQATVEAWVTEAIRDYGAHFHYRKTQTIAAVDDQHNYDLEDDLHEITLVEYPTGEDPPEYLTHRNRKDPAFFGYAGFYDWEPADAATAVVGELWISDDPDTGESIKVWYRAHYYDPTASPSDASVYVPDPHLPILVLFVMWKAAAERLNVEMQGPDYSNIIVGHMRGVVEQARSAYAQAISAAKQASSRSRVTEPWTVDAFDRVY